MPAKRNYKKEYEEYHSKPEQIKNRAARNAARRKMGLKVGDPREVDHRKPLSKGGSNSKKKLADCVKVNQQKEGRKIFITKPRKGLHTHNQKTQRKE